MTQWGLAKRRIRLKLTFGSSASNELYAVLDMTLIMYRVTRSILGIDRTCHFHPEQNLGTLEALEVSLENDLIYTQL